MNLPESEIRSLLDRELEDLFGEIGKELALKRTGIKPPSKDKLIAMGKSWLESNRAAICKALGANQKVRAYANGANIGLVELFTAICDVIAAFASVPSVATASAVIFKSGVTEICPGIKDKPSE